MTLGILSRRTRALTVAAAALTAGLGAAGVAGALSVHPHNASHTAGMTKASPYFLCLGYKQQWGICIGPPTN